MTAATLPALVDSAAARYGTRPALLANERGRWDVLDFDRLRNRVAALVVGLDSLGVEAGIRVGLLGAPSARLVIGHLALSALGGVTVEIAPEDTSGLGSVSLLVCDGDEAVVTALQARGDLKHIVYVERRGTVVPHDPRLAPLRSLLGEEGARTPAEAVRFDELVTGRSESDPLFVRENGTVVTHGDAIREARRWVGQFGLLQRDRTLVTEPYLDHNVLTSQVYASLDAGFAVAMPESLRTVRMAMHEVAPSYLVSSPEFYEGIAADVLRQVQRSPLVRRSVARWAIAAGLRAARGGWPARLLASPVAYLFAGKAITEKLGLDRARATVTTTAVTEPAVVTLFEGLAVPLRSAPDEIGRRAG